MCGFRKGGGREFRSPLKNHKNIGFLSKTGLDPLKNHKATKQVFNVGPSSARQRIKWYLDPPSPGQLIKKKKKKTLSKLDPPLTKLYGSTPVLFYAAKRNLIGLNNLKPIKWHSMYGGLPDIHAHRRCLSGYPLSHGVHNGTVLNRNINSHVYYEKTYTC